MSRNAESGKVPAGVPSDLQIWVPVDQVEAQKSSSSPTIRGWVEQAPRLSSGVKCVSMRVPELVPSVTQSSYAWFHGSPGLSALK